MSKKYLPGSRYYLGSQTKKEKPVKANDQKIDEYIPRKEKDASREAGKKVTGWGQEGVGSMKVANMTERQKETVRKNAEKKREAEFEKAFGSKKKKK